MNFLASSPSIPSISPSSSSVSLAPPNRADYPNVQFWTKSDFKEKVGKDSDVTVFKKEAGVKGKARVAHGENVSSLYLEDRNGKVIDGHKLSEIKALARQIFQQLLSEGSTSTKWGKASVVVQQYYRQAMYAQFPDLRLCDGHWKVDKLATESYPGWHRNHVAGDVSVKREDGSESDKPSVATPSEQKRCPEPTSVPLTKKAKVCSSDQTSSGARTPASTVPLETPAPSTPSDMPTSSPFLNVLNSPISFVAQVSPPFSDSLDAVMSTHFYTYPLL